MFNNQFNRKNHRNNYKRKTHKHRCPSGDTGGFVGVPSKLMTKYRMKK